MSFGCSEHCSLASQPHPTFTCPPVCRPGKAPSRYELSTRIRDNLKRGCKLLAVGNRATVHSQGSAGRAMFGAILFFSSIVETVRALSWGCLGGDRRLITTLTTRCEEKKERKRGAEASLDIRKQGLHRALLARVQKSMARSSR